MKINSFADKSTVPVTWVNLNFCINRQERENVVSHFYLFKKKHNFESEKWRRAICKKVKNGAEYFGKKVSPKEQMRTSTGAKLTPSGKTSSVERSQGRTPFTRPRTLSSMRLVSGSSSRTP